MDRSRQDEALARYQRTWRWTALVPSSAVFLIWTYLMFTFMADDSPMRHLVHVLCRSHLGCETNGFMELAAVHCLFALSPMLAWTLVRGAMRRTPAPPESAEGVHRSGPRTDRSWPVSGPFPWWAALMVFVDVVIKVSVTALVYILSYVFGGLAVLCLGPVYACFLYVWWKRCRRDASRVGVIEEVTKPDGSRWLVLRTPREVRPLTIAAWDSASRKLRLEGSREVWQVVDSIDDPIPIAETWTAAQRMTMNASRYDRALARYQRTWTWTALVPPFTVFLIGVYGMSTGGFDAWVFVAFPWVFTLSPMLAWALVRGAMRRRPAPPDSAGGVYRSEPRMRQSWPVSGPFPWWAASMFLVPVFVFLSPVLPAIPGFSAFANFLGSFQGPGLVLVVASVPYFWWRRCRRDASRVGVIEHVRSDDGSDGLMLHTSRDVQRVTIAECDRASSKLRLEGSRETWHAVDPIDELVGVDPTHMRHDGR